jgi:hypothetical protein
VVRDRRFPKTRAPLVIYHAGCRDGFAAAFCAWLYFEGKADFHPAYYGTDPPERGGGHVFILDFSYPREKMLKLATTSVIHVLDHHKTAEADLRDLVDDIGRLGVSSESPDEVIFDMGRSGAGIAWDYFNEGCPRPLFVNYVEDRDLWRWKLPHSQEINAYLGAIPFEFAEWKKLIGLTEDMLIERGLITAMKVKQYCVEVGKNARILDVLGCAEVPIVCAPQCDISELLEHLMDKHESFISVGWWQRADGKFQYSLRSRGELDVSEIAKRYGGGGHKNSAGFQLNSFIF